jgi:hypothetical protein
MPLSDRLMFVIHRIFDDLRDLTSYEEVIVTLYFVIESIDKAVGTDSISALMKMRKEVEQREQSVHKMMEEAIEGANRVNKEDGSSEGSEGSKTDNDK